MNPIKIALPIALLFLVTSQGHSQTFLNGDFEAGNTGFTSDYQFSEGNWNEGQFSVKTNPFLFNRNFATFGDHTSGIGKMLVVNGATSGDPALWRQTISLPANRTFRFRVWTATAVSGGPANLYLKVNGTQVGATFVLPVVSGSWVLWEQPWTSGAASSYKFEIVNANTSTYPNDFCIDDIGIVEAPLVLTPSRVSEGLSLVWPADPAWKLFTSPSLTGTSWNPCPASPVTTLGVKSVVIPLESPRAFFRLQYEP